MVLNWIDWVIVAVVSISCLISLQRGFIKEALSLLIWVLAACVAWMFGGSFAGYLIDYIVTPSVRVIAACIILFVLTLIVGGVTSYLIDALVRATGLSGTDRLLGVVFGAARGALLVVVLVGLVSLLPVQEDLWWQQSSLIPHFLVVADWSKSQILDFTGVTLP